MQIDDLEGSHYAVQDRGGSETTARPIAENLYLSAQLEAAKREIRDLKMENELYVNGWERAV